MHKGCSTKGSWHSHMPCLVACSHGPILVINVKNSETNMGVACVQTLPMSLNWLPCLPIGEHKCEGQKRSEDSVQWSLLDCSPVLSCPAMGAIVSYRRLPAITLGSWPVLPTCCILPHGHRKGRYVDCNIAEKSVGVTH